MAPLAKKRSQFSGRRFTPEERRLLEADPGMQIPMKHWTPSVVPPIVPFFADMYMPELLPATSRFHKRKADEHFDVRDAIEEEHPTLREAKRQKAIEAVGKYFEDAAVGGAGEHLDSASAGAMATLAYGRSYKPSFHNSVLGHLEGWHLVKAYQHVDAAEVNDAATQTDNFVPGAPAAASKRAGPVRRAKSAQRRLKQ